MLCDGNHNGLVVSTHLSFIILISYDDLMVNKSEPTNTQLEPNCALHLRESWSGHLWYQQPSWRLTLLSKRDSLLQVNLKLAHPPKTNPPPHPL